MIVPFRDLPLSDPMRVEAISITKVQLNTNNLQTGGRDGMLNALGNPQGPKAPSEVAIENASQGVLAKLHSV